MDKYICIHGHFYQPPRENPWLEEVELQDSAYPYHDWNERITTECYAPNSASRILGPDNTIIDIVNNYSKINYNFGPTLLSWMERHQPEVYQAILEADRVSAERYSGHGSAMAQIYNHMIMPLASSRDKRTQTLWGIEDFKKRFGRFPEGIWLPETAVDIETLEIIAEAGIRYTLLAEHQIKRIKKNSDERWEDVKEGRVDPTQAYLCRLPSGKEIHIFVYHGEISREVAFGNLLNSGDLFAARLGGAFREDHGRSQLVHIATDGETFGHHHPHADMALAYALYAIESKNIARLTNYGEYLEKNPPTHRVEIVEKSSWSCAHGVERWRSNCGCHIGASTGGKQGWRAPLRKGMDWLRERVSRHYEKEASLFLLDPWGARDAYIEVINNRSRSEVERFFKRHQSKPLKKGDISRMLKLLEMQKNAMLMYTSCGWFFDDISGIETIQIMQYASRVIQLAEETGSPALEKGFLSFLKEAPSDLYENGEIVYKEFVNSSRVDLQRVGAHQAILSLFDSVSGSSKIYSYTLNSQEYERMISEKRKLAIGKIGIASEVTWEEEIIGFAALDQGDYHLYCGIIPSPDPEAFSAIRKEIETVFNKRDTPGVTALFEQRFGPRIFSFASLFKDEQRRILEQMMKLSYDGISAAYSQIHEEHYTLMHFFKGLRLPLPKPLLMATGYLINSALQETLRQDDVDLFRLQSLFEEAKQWRVEVDKSELGLLASERIEGLLKKILSGSEETVYFEIVEKLFEIIAPLQAELNLWRSQNLYFAIGKKFLPKMSEVSKIGDDRAKKWTNAFHKLGQALKIRMSDG